MRLLCGTKCNFFFLSAEDNSQRRRFFSVAALSSNISICVCSLLLLFCFAMVREWKGVLESENFLSLHSLNDRTSHVSAYLSIHPSVCVYVCLSELSVCLSVCLSTHILNSLYINCLSKLAVYQRVHLSTYITIETVSFFLSFFRTVLSPLTWTSNTYQSLFLSLSLSIYSVLPHV